MTPHVHQCTIMNEKIQQNQYPGNNQLVIKNELKTEHSNGHLFPDN